MRSTLEKEIQSMKRKLLSSAIDWKGAEGSAGEPQRAEWLALVERIANLETPDEAIEILIDAGNDAEGWLIANSVDLVRAGMEPSLVPSAVISGLGELVAEQTWNGGSWVSVYKYGGSYYVLSEVEVACFESHEAAFDAAGIGNEVHDEIESVRVYAPSNTASQEDQQYPQEANHPLRSEPRTAALLIVRDWPGGTNAMRFGQALRRALKLSDGDLQLIAKAAARVYQVRTPATPKELEEAMASCEQGWQRRVTLIKL